MCWYVRSFALASCCVSDPCSLSLCSLFLCVPNRSFATSSERGGRGAVLACTLFGQGRAHSMQRVRHRHNGCDIRSGFLLLVFLISFASVVCLIRSFIVSFSFGIASLIPVSVCCGLRSELGRRRHGSAASDQYQSRTPDQRLLEAR